ncbi:MAG TPA: UpxY family transcription antiterminator [Candidatus Angelobacter sp.]|jgi:transcription antitermination factor NusG|nr:UpxY family transcription antiterminator [Candidatus Angelobacter sp.]
MQAGPSWFAAYVKSRHEAKIARLLEYHSIESFFPQYKSRRQWSDRTIDHLMPLFSGYLFVRIGLDQRMKVLEAPGVFFLVGPSHRPEALPDCEIEQIKAATLSSDPKPHTFIKVGERVVVTRGKLAGYEGLLLREKNKHRVVISLALIQRAMSVEVDEADISPAPAWRNQASIGHFSHA